MVAREKHTSRLTCISKFESEIWTQFHDSASIVTLQAQLKNSSAKHLGIFSKNPVTILESQTVNFWDIRNFPCFDNPLLYHSFELNVVRRLSVTLTLTILATDWPCYFADLMLTNKRYYCGKIQETSRKRKICRTNVRGWKRQADHEKYWQISYIIKNRGMMRVELYSRWANV